MLTILHAAILGLVEGVTEFLPISSTGHMILAARAMNLTQTDFLKSFEVIIQLGAILAVLTLYGKKLLLNAKIFKRVTIAFVPTAVIGLLFYSFVKKYLLGSTTVVLWSLAIGGLFLIVFEYIRRGRGQQKIDPLSNTKELESITYPQALGIGLFQALAIIPGVSRSAATIVGGLCLGISRATIVEFSFMLAVPTLVAATGLDLLKNGISFSGSERGLLLVGLIVAFVSALAAMKLLLRFVSNHTFVPFGIYRIVIAVAFLLYLV
jgi:undecaprenyl-diphosphatase